MGSCYQRDRQKVALLHFGRKKEGYDGHRTVPAWCARSPADCLGGYPGVSSAF